MRGAEGEVDVYGAGDGDERFPAAVDVVAAAAGGDVSHDGLDDDDDDDEVQSSRIVDWATRIDVIHGRGWWKCCLMLCLDYFSRFLLSRHSRWESRLRRSRLSAYYRH